MYLKSVHIKNYRRLKDVRIDLDKSASIFVGANNSGKTSVTHLIAQFLKKSGEPFTVHDFYAPIWAEFNKTGQQKLAGQQVKLREFPCITMDLWFEVEDVQIHRVIDLLPSLEWNKAVVGVRLQLEPKDPEALLNRFAEAHLKAREKMSGQKENGDTSFSDRVFHPWPKDLYDYLRKELNNSYATHFYVLDPAKFGQDGCEDAGYVPGKLGEGTGNKCLDIIKSLIRVDVMSAQRHLTDQDSSPSSRSESLSKRLSRFYRSRSEGRENDYETMQALDDSEKKMDSLFKDFFKSTFDALRKVGYPGFAGPQLQIRSSIEPEKLLGENAKVHYTLNGTEDAQIGAGANTLPDKYNGLGFKNLIYMIIELIDYRERWLNDPKPPPLHLIVIEEPEAHLHVQLQQVFISQVTKLLEENSSGEERPASQLIVTTHSPHVIYERGFSPIRYFRREKPASGSPVTRVLNLTMFSGSKNEKDDGRFLMKYMKLTHCDLFFADAAILVEGSVEKLLLPLMIEKAVPGLMTKYLSVLEVGGTFAHRFRPLIEFLGVTTLIITDLDSVSHKTSKACPTTEPDARTSNQTLKEWLPEKKLISELLSANEDQKIQIKTGEGKPSVRVAYQVSRSVTWKGETKELAGRTFEEMFALENLAWCQDKQRDGLRLRGEEEADQTTLTEMARALFDRVNSKSFKKTEFALNLLMEDRVEDCETWNVPHYIVEGLKWLEGELAHSETEGSAETPAEGSVP
ncbi:MAG: AAA family ATPase [Magnetococcales bacterium]|nr:AAA family ATPase [Magnetococcales bacterium]